MGGLSIDGKSSLTVPYNFPCYISLVNSRHNNIDFTLYGAPVNQTAFMMRINYPFSVSDYNVLEFGKAYRINKADDITILYLGSIVEANTTSFLEWKSVPDPVQTKPNSSFKLT